MRERCSSEIVIKGTGCLAPCPNEGLWWNADYNGYLCHRCRILAQPWSDGVWVSVQDLEAAAVGFLQKMRTVN